MTDSDRRTAAEPPAGEPDELAAPPAEAGGEGAPLAGDGDAPPPPAARPAKKGTDWWSELKAIFWLILAVLAFHSFVAKPFYIPSESMMPVLLQGDRLVVSKYPYGWSWVSPSFHVFPRTRGRLLGALPERGDIVIVTPPGQSTDYIKRVIGLPGDTIEMVAGQLIINGEPVRQEERPPTMLPVDENLKCMVHVTENGTPTGYPDARVRGPDGRLYCRLPIVREYLPNGRYYDTIDLGPSDADDFRRIRVPDGHVFLMGDNRDQSADSRASIASSGLGGPVPWENIGGRAEFITFSLDGSSSYFNPISWFTALRGGRAGTSLRPERVEPAPEEAGR